MCELDGKKGHFEMCYKLLTNEYVHVGKYVVCTYGFSLHDIIFF